MKQKMSEKLTVLINSGRFSQAYSYSSRLA